MLVAGATAGVSARGTACARWKKFHFFEGFATSFSALPFLDDFSQRPSLLSLVTSLAESLRPDAVLEPGVSVVFIVRDVRRDAKAGRKDRLESSSLSEGLRRPRVVFFNGDFPRVVSGIAEGNNVGLFPIADCDVLLLVFFRL